MHIVQMILASKPYQPEATYWLLVGQQNGKYTYALLGRFIKGVFEFRNSEAKEPYIYREDIHPERV
jgi:hypothetical protein